MIKRTVIFIMVAAIMICLSGCDINSTYKPEEKHETHNETLSESESYTSSVSGVDMKTRIGSPNDCQQVKELYGCGFLFDKNSVDGISIVWGARNNSEKTINYCTATFHFYNPVGDSARSEITDKATKTIRLVGPIAPGEDLLYYGDNIDYVPTCSKIVIEKLILEYSDGTVESGDYNWSTTIMQSLS